MLRTISFRAGLVFAVFIALLVGAFLATNSVLVRQEDDGMIVNMAGMERARSQKLVKQVLLYDRNPDQDARHEMMGRINRTITVFDETLTALRQGGPAPAGASPRTVRTTGVTEVPEPSAAVAEHLATVQSHWDPFRDALIRYLDSNGQDRDAFDYIVGHDVDLVSAIHETIGTMADESAARVSGLRTTFMILVIIGILVTLLGFVIVRMSVTGPLTQLQSAADKMSRGDIDTQVKVTGSQEIEMLSDAFERLRLSFASMVDTAESGGDDSFGDDLDDDFDDL